VDGVTIDGELDRDPVTGWTGTFTIGGSGEVVVLRNGTLLQSSR
jgi:hypothetical protein